MEMTHIVPRDHRTPDLEEQHHYECRKCGRKEMVRLPGKRR